MIPAVACKAALRRVFEAYFPKKDEAHIPNAVRSYEIGGLSLLTADNSLSQP